MITLRMLSTIAFFSTLHVAIPAHAMKHPSSLAYGSQKNSIMWDVKEVLLNGASAVLFGYMAYDTFSCSKPLSFTGAIACLYCMNRGTTALSSLCSTLFYSSSKINASLEENEETEEKNGQTLSQNNYSAFRACTKALELGLQAASLYSCYTRHYYISIGSIGASALLHTLYGQQRAQTLTKKSTHRESSCKINRFYTHWKKIAQLFPDKIDENTQEEVEKINNAFSTLSGLLNKNSSFNSTTTDAAKLIDIAGTLRALLNALYIRALLMSNSLGGCVISQNNTYLDLNFRNGYKAEEQKLISQYLPLVKLLCKIGLLYCSLLKNFTMIPKKKLKEIKETSTSIITLLNETSDLCTIYKALYPQSFLCTPKCLENAGLILKNMRYPDQECPSIDTNITKTLEKLEILIKEEWPAKSKQ